MKLLILPDAAQAVARAAGLIAARLRRAPGSVLGLATGGTMEPVYAELVRLSRAGLAPAGQMRSFNLDEYVGLPAEHPQSYRQFMEHHLFGPLAIDAGRSYLPDGMAADPEAEAARYDAAIAEAGGIDLQLLGIGANGHIGFNEPTSSLASRSRVKTLARRTLEDNRRFFGPGEVVPRFAITMGIGTILEAREVLLLATGAGKAQAVAGMVEGPLAAACPASALQLHPRATVICDAAAAGNLALRDYYETVHPAGGETPLHRTGSEG